MSLESWKAEYHVDLPKRATVLEMLLAAEWKYVGGRAANLKRHGLVPSHGTVREKVVKGIPGYHFGFHCALCDHYSPHCERCPLYQSRQEDCDAPDAKSPWGAWELDADPEPMLALIWAAIRTERKRLARRAAK